VFRWRQPISAYCAGRSFSVSVVRSLCPEAFRPADRGWSV